WANPPPLIPLIDQTQPEPSSDASVSAASVVLSSAPQPPRSARPTRLHPRFASRIGSSCLPSETQAALPRAHHIDRPLLRAADPRVRDRDFVEPHLERRKTLLR